METTGIDKREKTKKGASKQTIELSVEGMQCAGCVNKVQEGLLSVKGVEKASVNLATESANLEVDPDQLNPAEIEQAIQKSGFSIPPAETNLQIEGMHCASCVSKVETALKNVPGVMEASVNLGSEEAFVKYNPVTSGISDLQEAVKSSGYTVISEQSDNGFEKRKAAQYKQLRLKFIIAVILSLPVTILEMSLMFENVPLLHNLPMQVWNYLFFALTTPVLFWCGSRFFTGALAMAKTFSADMNTLVALGTSAAYLYSAAATFYPSFFFEAGVEPHVYYDTTVVIITLILLGRLLEDRAKGRASNAIKKLMNLSPSEAQVIRNGEEVNIPVSQIEKGDHILVRPGDKVPVDGIVIKGHATMDESMITGEPVPVDKKTDDPVTGGTINTSGSITFSATKIGKDTTLSQIIQLVRQAQASKAPIQKTVDKVASVFVPIVIVIALLTLTGWSILGSGDGKYTIALLNFIAVLVIACPCALGLATPTAIMSGTGKGAEMGILIKNSESLEKARAINVVILDKTGTMTAGKPEVFEVNTLINGIEKSEMLKLVASAEYASEHPLARSIMDYTRDNGYEFPTAESFESFPGEGVRAIVEGKVVLAGKPGLMERFNVTLPDDIHSGQKAGKTVIYVAIEGTFTGTISLFDSLRKDTKEAVSQLKKLGLKVIMITGDNQTTAEAIAEMAGINDFMAEVMPGEKADKVRELQEQGYKVAMVGDGINDAPALAQADLGISIGSGTDIAIEASDITLMQSNITSVVNALALSRRTLITIRQNLFWAFIYNSIGIPLAAFGLLNPMFAAFAMAFSSVSVVSNSLRLKYFHRR